MLHQTLIADLSLGYCYALKDDYIYTVDYSTKLLYLNFD